MSIFNPWFWLALLLGIVMCVGGGYMWGHHAASNAAADATIHQDTVVQAAQSTRDTTVASIGVATAGSVAVALNTEQVHINDSLPRILTMAVPAACVDKPADVVHTLADEAARINAEIRAGLRPGTPGTRATRARDGTPPQRLGAAAAGAIR